MAWTPYYSGGWQSGEQGGTPITPAALNNMENGIKAANDGITAYEFGSRTKAQLEIAINEGLAGKDNGYYRFVHLNIAVASTPFGATNYVGWIAVNASSRYTAMLFEQSTNTVIRGNYNGTTWNWDKLVLASEIPNNTYDFSVSVSSGSNYRSIATGLSAAQIRSIEVIYNDDFFYNPCAVALSNDTGNINVKLFSNATADRTYVIRVYHI